MINGEAATSAPRVEFVRAEPPFADGDFFDRGERIIMVDGVRWGRTRMRWHGRRGASIHFEQHGGHPICQKADEKDYWKEFNWLKVDSPWKHDRNNGKMVWLDHKLVKNPAYRSHQDLALDKVRELIAAGRLRHPETVAAEQAEALRIWREGRAAEEAERDRAFRDRACQAIGINQDDGSDIINRVVEAMRWAREQ